MYIYLSIELATDFSLYLDTNLQSPACLWIEEWRLKIPQKLFPQIFNPPNLRGDWRSEEKILWNLQSEGEKASIRLPIPFHSIRPSVHPSYPSTHTVHPSIHPFRSSTYLSTYLSTNLSSYLSFDPSIYLIIYFHTTLQSLGCMWIEDSRKNNLQSKEGYRGYRQQEALRSLQTDYKAKLHRFWHLLMQIAWPVSFSNFPSAADGHILLNAPDLFGSA